MFLRRLRNAFSRFPVTNTALLICAMLYGGVLAQKFLAQRHLPAVVPQVLRIYGLDDIWTGAWWGIILNGFHHGGLWHLAMNGLSLWFLGMMLEPRLRPSIYALFLLSSVAVSMLPEFFIGNQAVGISGALCAMLGATMVLRRYDEWVAFVLNGRAVGIALAWLFACLFLSYYQIAPIANAAHFSGLLYGWIAGHLFFDPRYRRTSILAGFCLLHLALIPAFWYTVAPVYNPEYHWFQSTRVSNREAKLAHLQEATQLAPNEPRYWIGLANWYREEYEPLQAWKTILTGLKFNRDSESNKQLDLYLQYLLQFFQSKAERAEARNVFLQVMGDEAEAWEQRLQQRDPLFAMVLDPNWRPPLQQTLPWSLLPDALQESLQKITPSVPSRAPFAPQIDPERPESASEGVTL